MCSSLCQSANKGILRNMSLMNVRLPGLLPRVECIAAFMACIAVDKISSMYSLALAISWNFFDVVHTHLMWHFWGSFSSWNLWKKQTNKQRNKQQLWFVFLVWNLGLGFCLRILTWDHDRYNKCFILMRFSMHLNFPRSFCHLIYFSGKSSCQPFDVDL